MGSTGVYRLSDEQVPWALQVLKASGGTARTPETWRQDRMAALVLGERGGGEAHAPLMPISRRALGLGAGREVAVGWVSSNHFAARMGTRRQSRATAGQWPELLPELDALVAVHRENVGPVGRWYGRVGFHPVLALRCLYLQMDQPPASVPGRLLMRLIGPEQVERWGAQMAQVHQEVFGHYGGPVVRSANFWGPVLAQHYYREHYQFQILGLWAEGGAEGGGGNEGASATDAGERGEVLMGYAVVGWSGWHSKSPRMDILELATRQWDRSVAEELIATTCQLAWSKNVHEVRAVLSVHDPYRAHLVRTGFEDRWGYRMVAKWLQPQRFLDRLFGTVGSAGSGGGGGTRVQLSIPGQVDLSLPLGGGGQSLSGGGASAEAAGRVVRLQVDEAAATRLLLGRLELPAALREGQVLPLEASESDLTRLAMTLPWTPWAFHMLDYI